jgi:hypothetical protein
MKTILVTHCFLHSETLVTKTIEENLKLVLGKEVKMVNFINSTPLKSLEFGCICDGMETKYKNTNV